MLMCIGLLAVEIVHVRLCTTSDAVLMIEGFCDWLSEEQMIEVRGWAGWRWM